MERPYGIDSNDNTIPVVLLLDCARQASDCTTSPSACDQSIDRSRGRSLGSRWRRGNRLHNLRTSGVLVGKRVVDLGSNDTVS